jgi:hypothetical protein
LQLLAGINTGSVVVIEGKGNNMEVMLPSYQSLDQAIPLWSTVSKSWRQVR